MLRLLSAAPLILLATTALAHEDDPKLLDRQEAVRGPGWTLGSTRAATVGGAGSIPASSMMFPAQGVELLAWMTLDDLGLNSSSGNDCWGYTSPSGRKYALMGTANGTSFVEITNPTQPVLVAAISGPSSLWRDIKTYQDHAYVVSEGGGGVQVFDMSQIDSGNVIQRPSVTSGPGTSATHNVAIDTTSGFLYRTGGGDEGLRIYSLANPSFPQYVAEWPDRYVHDAQAITFTSGPYAGRQIVFACSGFNGGFGDTAVDVLDVTNKQNIIEMSRESWPSAAYSHQAWLGENAQYLYVNDELDENGSINTRTVVLDVSNLNNATYVGSFSCPTPAVGHNLYTEDGLLYEANYRSGLRILDVASNPTSPQEIAFFDTYPENDSAEFNGLWSVYPYFDDGIVIGSDLEKGLFVWFVGDPAIDLDVLAVPTPVDSGGDSFQVQITEAEAGVLVPGSARLVYDFGTGPQTSALVDLGAGLYEAVFPSLPCGATVEFYVTAESTDGLVWNAPDLGSEGPYRAGIGAEEVVLGAFNMNAPAGWVGGQAGDTATTGQWTRVDPIGTEAQPEDDHTPGAGGRAWVTGQGSSGGSLGENDVDNGFTTLLTPNLDLSSSPGAQVSYYRWYDNGANGVVDDVFDVDLSNNGGLSWVPVERIGPVEGDTSGGWVEFRFAIGAYLPPTSQVRLRFRARDEGSGSIVEAAIDDLTVFALECSDCNGNGVADGLDVLNGATDLNGDWIPDGCAPLVGFPDSISVAGGGAQQFKLDAGPARAGEIFALLASASGSSPGLPLGPGVVLPLVVDAFTDFSALSANLPPYANNFGVLDAFGSAQSSLTIPPGTSAALATLTLTHAYATFDLVTGEAQFASNPVTVDLLP